jgi:3-dehydroquinate synthase
MGTQAWLRLDFPPHSYEYGVGEGVLASLGPKLSQLVRSTGAVVVADETVAALPVAVAVEASLEGVGFVPTRIVVPPGESSKSLATAERVWDRFAQAGLGADGVVVAVGGGVVGDLAGFCAATWMRGVALVHVPTTLLAMCDSSVGGKTAIDLPCGKNLVGAFHQPRLVVAEINALDSLPDREYRSGFAEIVKCALLLSRAELARLRAAAPRMRLGERADLLAAIDLAVRVKAEHVRDDVLDRNDRRALLNLGHTVAHAIETESGYVAYLHGEAVAVGLVVAARVAEARGLCAADLVAELEQTLAAFGLVSALPGGLAPRSVVDRTRMDKKRRGTRRRMVLPHARGGAGVYDVQDAELLAALTA